MTAVRSRTVTALLIGALAFPALAQSTVAPPPSSDPAQEAARGYANPPMPNQAAINAGGQAGTAALNDGASAASQMQSSSDAATVAMTAANQAQYDADRQAYMDALVRHDAAVDRTDARYARQRNAYADAMSVWRAQVAACKRGHQKACDMPTPNPADYY